MSLKRATGSALSEAAHDLISGLVLGIFIVGVYFCLYAKRNKKIVQWIARNIFRDPNMTPSADSAFKVATSFMLMFGGLIIILAFLYLTH